MDVVKILEKLEELGYVRLSRITGDYYTVYCPFHKDGQERKPSCGVLLHDVYKNRQRYPAGMWHCFTCGHAKNMVDSVSDILKMHKLSTSGLDWLKENIPGFDPEVDGEDLLDSELIESVSSKYAVNYVNLLKNQENVTYISEDQLARYRYTVPYMYERGLTDEIIAKYDIGFDGEYVPEGRKKPIPCITFPVRDAKGNTLFFCRRSVEGKFFSYPRGVTKPVYGLFELPEHPKRVVICESCFNALTCVKYGDPAVALLGTGNPYQIQQLRQLGVREFVTGFDPDEAGKRATDKIRKALSDVAIVWSFEGIPSGKDLNNLDYEEYKSLSLS